MEALFCLEDILRIDFQDLYLDQQPREPNRMMVSLAIYTIYLDLSNDVIVQYAHDLWHIGKLLHIILGIQDKGANML